MDDSMMAHVNWLAVVVAAIAPFAVGFLWYGPLFGKAWMAGSGMTPERAEQGNMPMIFGLSLVLQLVQAGALAMFIGAEATLGFAVLAGFMTGAFWVATAMGITYLFEQRPMGHFLVNASYHIVAFTAMGAILGAWR